MALPKFDYVEPATVEEACSLLRDEKGRAKVMAGGTDLVVRMKQRLVDSCCLINIKKIQGLTRITENGEGIRIGTLARLCDIETSLPVQRAVPIIAQAAGCVGSPQIRSMGTIGGNICLQTRCWYYNQSYSWRKVRPPCFKTGGDRCYVVKAGQRCHALFLGDTVPALMTLGARVTIVSSVEKRMVDIEKLYTGAGERPIALGEDEMVTEVHLDRQPPRSRAVYLKHALRQGINFGIVSVAARIALEPDGDTCSDVTIALSGISSRPKRAVKAEGTLRGNRLTDSLIDEAAHVALKETGPVVYIDTPAAYRREMVATLTRRAVKEAFLLAQQEVKHG